MLSIYLLLPPIVHAFLSVNENGVPPSAKSSNCFIGSVRLIVWVKVFKVLKIVQVPPLLRNAYIII
jgi:hypothetical protein